MLVLQVENLYQDAKYSLSVTPFNRQHRRNYYLRGSQLRMNRISGEAFCKQYTENAGYFND